MNVLLMIYVFFAVSEQVLPLPLETPPFEYTCSAADEIPLQIQLVKCIPNRVTDYETWFDRLQREWPGATFNNGGINDSVRGDIPPAGIPAVLYTPGNGVFNLYQTINSTDFVIAFYGDPPNRFGVVLNPRILVLLNKDIFKTVKVLDFLTYGHDPSETLSGEIDFTFQALRWAEAENGVLYVSNAHRTYASSSDGCNAFITAIDISTLEILWRSRALVSNSVNFILLDDVIITGYGFTEEEDFVYVLDRNTGEILQSVPVPSSPEYMQREGNTLYVRCYNCDCVFNIVL